MTRILVRQGSIVMMGSVWTCACLQSAVQIIIAKKENANPFKPNAKMIRTVKKASSAMKELA